MKLTILLANLLTLGTFITTTEAGCYPFGHLGSTAELIKHSKAACEGYPGNAGRFQGTFAPNEKTSVCVTVGNNRINMEVQNLNQHKSIDIKDSDCSKEFRKITQMCQHLGAAGKNGGGDSNVAGWYFRLDPNVGKC